MMTLILIVVTILFLIVIFVVAGIMMSRQTEEAEVLPYKLKKYFFTKSEQEFLRILEQKIDHTKYTIFPKVRMGDFVEVDLPKTERMPYWNRIRSRHIDFLIWNIEKNSIAGAIELDGNSHNSERAQESDEFKNKVYETIGIPLYRVRVGSSFDNEINQILQKL